MIINKIKRLLHNHKWSYIGKYYKFELADNLESYDFKLYKVWYCSCGVYKAKLLNLNNIDVFKVTETCAKYDCQGIKQLVKLEGDVIEIN